MLARGGLRRQRDCPWARVETESSREHSMMARYSLMQRVTWALTGSATQFVVVLCAVVSLSFGQVEDARVNAVLVTEAEQVLGQLKQGHDMPIQHSQPDWSGARQHGPIDGQAEGV